MSYNLNQNPNHPWYAPSDASIADTKALTLALYPHFENTPDCTGIRDVAWSLVKELGLEHADVTDAINRVKLLRNDTDLDVYDQETERRWNKIVTGG